MSTNTTRSRENFILEQSEGSPSAARLTECGRSFAELIVSAVEGLRMTSSGEPAVFEKIDSFRRGEGATRVADAPRFARGDPGAPLVQRPLGAGWLP